MLGEAISSVPVWLSLTGRTIGSDHGDHALLHAALSALTLRAPDARAQGTRAPDGLAAPRPLAGPAADPRLPGRDGARDQDRRAPAAGLAGDLAGAGGGEARAGALPGGSRATQGGGGRRALGGRGSAGRAAAHRPLDLGPSPGVAGDDRPRH